MLNIRDEYLDMIADAIRGHCIAMHDADTRTIYFVNDRPTLNADAKLSYAFDLGGIGIKLTLRGEYILGKRDEFERYEFGDGCNFSMLLDEIQCVANEAKYLPAPV